MKGRLLGQESENTLQNHRTTEAGRGTWRSFGPGDHLEVHPSA